MTSLFSCGSKDELFTDRTIDAIRAETEVNGFSLVRGVVTPDDVAKIRTHIAGIYDPTKDVRRSGDYKPGANDIQRLDLGEYPASSRCARYFFFFPWNNGDSFREINDLEMELFNRLARKPNTFGSTQGNDTHPDRFRVSFVLQYPNGAGFMSRHAEKTGKEEGDKAYVVYLALTTRGKDFHAGGAYIYRKDEKIDLDGMVQAGDLVIYRGDWDHGVANIDPDNTPEFKQLCGRMILTTVVKYYGS